MNLMINYSSKWWYKLITIILVFALILYFSIGFAPKASAVVVSTVIVGSVLAAMAATGIGLAVSGMTAQELTQWVSDKLNDWTADIGGSIQDHIDNSLIGVTAGGVLAIGSAAAQGIADFISWLQTEDSITDNSTIPIISGVPEIPVMHTTPSYNDVYNNGLALFTKAGRPSTAKGIVYIPNNNITSAKVLGYQSNNPDSDPTWSICVGFTSSSQISNWTLYYIDEYGSFNYAYTSTLYTSSNHLNYQFSMYYSSQPNYLIPMKIGETELFNALAGPSQSLDYETGTITIPTIDANEKWYLDVGADAGEDVDTVTDGVITDTLTNTLDVSDEIVESNVQEVVIVNEDAIAVNVDHHMIGFTNLPDFAHLNLNSIWHYVSDAVDFASSWLAWFVSFLTAMPLLAIPLYMSFTLLVVLSFLRRFI